MANHNQFDDRFLCLCLASSRLGEFPNGLRKANGGSLDDDIVAARLTHVQGFFRWAYIHGAIPLMPEMVKGFIHKSRVKQLSPRDILDASEVGAMLKVARSAEDPTQAKRERTRLSGSWLTRG